jgi:dolichol-phosphate mannosyltransferase
MSQRAVVAPLLDIVVFVTAMGAGMKLPAAHLLSFGLAYVLNYFVSLRGTAVAAGRGGDLRLHVHVLIVSLFAVFLRGGVLGLLTNVWGWSPQVAIVLVAALTMIITFYGYALALDTGMWTLGDGEQWRRVAMWLVVAGFLLRLIYITQVELLPEDSYYWNYARHLDIGYLDHPPMVAWLIWLGTAVFGDTEFGVRISAWCCALVASWFVYRFTRNLFGEASAVVALVLMQALPFFFLSGMLMTPDAPLTVAWAAALYFLERALIGAQSRAWLLAGLGIGLGLISKYTIGLLVPAALLFVILDPPSRRWLLRWEPYAALLLAVVIFSPVILWNAQHEWASFAFQTSRRLAETPRFALHKLIISMLVLLTPTGLVTLLLSRFVNRGADDAAQEARRWLFLRLAALVPLSVFVVFSLRHDVKIDWTGALWISVVPVLATSAVSFGRAGVRGIRGWAYRAWGPTAVFMLLLYAVGLHYLALGLPGVGYGSHPELVPVGWRDLGRQVNALAHGIRARTGQDPIIVGMDRYELASQLSFYLPAAARPRITSRNLFGQNGLMYGRWAASLPVGARTLLLVAWDPHDISDEITAGYTSSPDPPSEGTLTRGGIVIRNFRYRIAHGLTGAQAEEIPRSASGATRETGH